MTAPGWLGAFGTASYRRVWVVATLPHFGYWLSSIPFQWLVALKTDHDPLMLSLLYFFMLLPMLLLSLPAGALADARDRRRVILSSQSAAVTISAVTATLVFLDRAPVTVLMACGFAVGAAHAFGMPASQALVANAVPTEDLRSAVVLQAMGMNLARFIGPAVAGVLILVWGTVESLLAYGVLGLAGILVLRGLVLVPRERQPEPGGLFTRIRDGLTHAWARRPAGVALAIVAVTSLFAISYIAQLPTLAARVSDDPAVFLLLTCVGGVGSLAGVLTVTLRPVGAPSVTPPAVMLALLGAIVVGLAFSRHLWLEVVLVTIGGALQFGIMTHCGSVIQQVVADDHRGRVMSLYLVCWGGLLPVGGLLLGTSWNAAGPRVALGVSGCVAGAFALYVLRPGAVRSVQREGVLPRTTLDEQFAERQ